MRLVGVLTSDSASVYSRASTPVADEIAMALQLHRKSANGLILGLEKYRQLRARANGLSGSYKGISIIIDATQPFRISVF